jgi:hypothetical protein
MVICINHFFSQPVSSPRDSLGNRLPELAGERFLVVHAWERNSLLPQKGFKAQSFPQSPFSVAFPESQPKHNHAQQKRLA